MNFQFSRYYQRLHPVLPVFLLILLAACGRPASQRTTKKETGRLPTGQAQTLKVLTEPGSEATDPYLSRDHQGNLVLCWTERPRDKEKYLLKYAVFDTVRSAFGPPVTVGPSLGTKTSAESANKVAFKSDGTVVALFGKRFEDPENRFAGAIRYTLSNDKGVSWTAPRYLHSDTTHQYGRGFFDIALLANGELGAIWLDGRFGEADTGSALFFASTRPGGGFGPDKQIGQSTCECCRTDLLVDSAGTIHLAYRDILVPPGRMGKPVRDIVYSRSVDNGVSFLPPVRISADNWEVAGCPHAGPSLTPGAGGICAVWFTGGPGTDEGIGPGPASASPGVYRAGLVNGGGAFSARELLSRHARHPQVAALAGGRIAMVWDETNGRPATLHQHGHEAGVQHQSGSGGMPAVVLTLRGPAGESHTQEVTDGSYPAHHPVVASPAAGKLLVAWVSEQNGVSVISYSLLKLPFPKETASL